MRPPGREGPTRAGLGWDRTGRGWAGLGWGGMGWYGMVWYGMVWYGMVWYGLVWYGMVWERIDLDVMKLATDRRQLFAVRLARYEEQVALDGRSLPVFTCRARHSHGARWHLHPEESREYHEQHWHYTRRYANVGDHVQCGEVDVSRVVTGLHELGLGWLSDGLELPPFCLLRLQLHVGLLQLSAHL